MATARERRKQARVDLVLDAAGELFAQQGYDETKIEQIAAEADVAPATVYNYFSTKPNILMALAVRHVRASWRERRALVRDPPAEPVAAIRAFESLLADQALRTLNRSCWRIILSAPYREPGSPVDRLSQRFTSLIHRHYVQMLSAFQRRGAIKREIDVDQLASLVTAIGTFHFGRLVANEAMTVDQLKASIEAHLDLVFMGVIADGTSTTKEMMHG